MRIDHGCFSIEKTDFRNQTPYQLSDLSQFFMKKNEKSNRGFGRQELEHLTISGTDPSSDDFFRFPEGPNPSVRNDDEIFFIRHLNRSVFQPEVWCSITVSLIAFDKDDLNADPRPITNLDDLNPDEDIHMSVTLNGFGTDRHLHEDYFHAVIALAGLSLEKMIYDVNDRAKAKGSALVNFEYYGDVACGDYFEHASELAEQLDIVFNIMDESGRLSNRFNRQIDHFV